MPVPVPVPARIANRAHTSEPREPDRRPRPCRVCEPGSPGGDPGTGATDRDTETLGGRATGLARRDREPDGTRDSPCARRRRVYYLHDNIVGPACTVVCAYTVSVFAIWSGCGHLAPTATYPCMYETIFSSCRLYSECERPIPWNSRISLSAITSAQIAYPVSLGCIPSAAK